MTIRFITARQWMRQFDKECLRREFRSRQLGLAAVAIVQIVGFAYTGFYFFAALAALVIQAGAVEAERFRKSGKWWQTKRAIWRGSTAWDARAHRWCPKPERSWCPRP